MLPLVFAFVLAGWLSPGLRAHEDEFRQAWLRRFGPGTPGGTERPPPSTYKTWYRQWKKTQIGPEEWLAALQQGPPGSGDV